MKIMGALGFVLALAIAVVGFSLAAEDSEQACSSEKSCSGQQATGACCSAEKACSAEATAAAGCSLAGSGAAGCCSEQASLASCCGGEAACSAKAGSAEKGGTAKKVALVCPFSGNPASEAVAVDFNGGKVYFCCGACKAKFEKNPQKYAAKANHQLVLTGQAKQVACPVSGGKFNKEVKLKLAGVDVAFFCNACKAAVAKAKPDQQLELVFGEEAFNKAFEIKKELAKKESAKEKKKG